MTTNELLQQRIDASKEAIRQTDLLLLQEMDQEDRGDWPHEELPDWPVETAGYSDHAHTEIAAMRKP